MTSQEKRHLLAVERGKKTSSSASIRARAPGGPAISSGRFRQARNWASRSRNGSAPKWSPCRCESTMPSIRSGSRPCALSATREDAPQSTSSVPLAVSRKKQVLNRPPEPKASPEPTTVRRMSRRRARPCRNLGVPTLEIPERVGDRELRRLHEIDGDEAGDVGDRELVTGDERSVGELAVEQGDELQDARLVGLSPGRHLRDLHRFHRRMRVAKNVRNRKQEMQFEAPVPH